MGQAPDELQPLRAIEFEVLLALHHGDLHGYGLAKAIEERTQGRLRIEPANLYRRLQRLVEADLVAISGRRAGGDAAGEPRRYFRITPLGRRTFAAEAIRLKDQVDAAAGLGLIAATKGKR